MALEGVDQEILEDFMVEAGEIIDNISNQLVDLEKTPDDHELLNSIFRGFHTVKGGASFLNFKELVDVCHGAESVFDALRKGSCRVTHELMDVVLQAYDCICNMFMEIKQDSYPKIPEDYSNILEKLAQVIDPEQSAGKATSPAQSEPEHQVAADSPDNSGKEFSDADFDALLDALNTGSLPDSDSSGAAEKKTVDLKKNTPVQHEFSDDDFEALLDSLNNTGDNKSPDNKSTKAKNISQIASSVTDAKKEAVSDKNPQKEFTDDDFEALLDSLNKDNKNTNTAQSESSVAGAEAGITGNKAKVKDGEMGDVKTDTPQKEFTDSDFEALLNSLAAGQGDKANTGDNSSLKCKSGTDPVDADFEAMLAAAEATPVSIPELKNLDNVSSSENSEKDNEKKVSAPYSDAHIGDNPSGKPPVISQVSSKTSVSAASDISSTKADTNVSDKTSAGTSGTSKGMEQKVMSFGSKGGIADDDFDALLDSLYGAGNFPTGEKSDEGKEDKSEPENTVADTGVQENSKTTAPSRNVSNISGTATDVKTGTGSGSILEAIKKSLGSSKSATTGKVATQNTSQKNADDDIPGAKPAVNAEHSRTSLATVADSTVRVDIKVIDSIMNMVGELVLVRNRLLGLSSTHADVGSNIEEIQKAIGNLNLITGDIQGLVMKTRMQPIKKVFGRFPRVVRDLARTLNKEIELVMEGEDTDLDRNLIDGLADLMIHLVRNACDHGIETVEERVKAGKSPKGTVTLSAAQHGDHVLLRVSDDGSGLDPQLIKDTAVRKGIIDREYADSLTENEIFNLIFAPGFSTKKKISDISGRGVGMDVVKTSITKLNGTLTVFSHKGEGTIIEIKVPLTLAIIQTMMIGLGGQNFALPLSSINEIFFLDLSSINVVDGQQMIIIREKAYPLFFLQDWLIRDKKKVTHPKNAHVIMVRNGTDQMVAFVVDELLGQEEVVIKPLDRLLHRTPGIAGSAITSKGGIALIIDIAGLLRFYARRYISSMYKKMNSNFSKNSKSSNSRNADSGNAGDSEKNNSSVVSTVDSAEKQSPNKDNN